VAKAAKAAKPAEPAAAEADGSAPKPKGGRKKLLLLALVPGILGGKAPPAELADGQSAPPPPPGPPVFHDLPDVVVNLNAPGRRASFIKVKPRLELVRPEDAAVVTAALPRLLDLFTTYLREVRPEELRGSAGTQRLREELLARANIAVAQQVKPGQPPVRISDVLFAEILQQ
jgi:flagellar protein FliL